eukprot:159440-Rhodomonas_salina.1
MPYQATSGTYLGCAGTRRGKGKAGGGVKGAGIFFSGLLFNLADTRTHRHPPIYVVLSSSPDILLALAPLKCPDKAYGAMRCA